ncbi:UNVERIFIED_ORG: hypothetical protein M2438_001914 [Methylobacterium sp. SuP10 SLI 274]|uniref:hypothetical protein n=1 Tax=Methylorubrum extorquens TaxID=408 RepID=UPI0020A064F6|nr:hypothetical protein [Methylorubrum extorquens]MDF9791431.1 hypothetical protein [Methylorubrum extorquens]MDF9863127.1 hypothetical protein [Methylorubrum pseudosasae]MDH6636739.1 hypothetical protein [Methylobacterium sp. SuP10 SLI 274]MDH6665916.1 hypothetical protein [Methylorubrum zatmanii]
MAQDLTTRSAAALPAIDMADPASMLLLPDWLASQLAAVSDLGAGRTEVDPVTRQITARVATIPASRMPTGPQRTAIARRIADLQAATEAGPVGETIAALGDLIQEYAPTRLDDRTVSIKAEAYLDGLEDLPAWAIRASIRRWRRGETGLPPEVHDFAPKPARLRVIAERLVLVARGQAARLQRVLDAKPEERITDAQMAANSEKLTELIAKTADGPVVEPAGAESAERRAAMADLDERRKRREAREREGAPAPETSA